MPQLSSPLQFVLTIVSFLLVAFGQPALCWWCGLISAAFGFALFFCVLLSHENWRHRFYLGLAWFTGIQLVQLSWFISHPYSYILGVYAFLSIAMGIQFGFIGILVTPNRISQISKIIAISSLWTLFEWSRLFFLSGFSWNPIGLELAGSSFSLQMASIWGVFGLSFWVMLINLLALRAWIFCRNIQSIAVWSALAILPYVYGGIQYSIHEISINTNSKPLSAVLVQTAFPLEEMGGAQSLSVVAQEEWEKILKIISKHKDQEMDLMVFPEIVVPFSAYTWIYPYDIVEAAFKELLGPESLASFPEVKSPFARDMDLNGVTRKYVNNAFWGQAIANYFNTGVLVGLEDVEFNAAGIMELYSSALYFKPQADKAIPPEMPAQRYDKRVLLPMGEYIPFDFCRSIAATYGIHGSFTGGLGPKIFMAKQVPFGVSICYDETFGNIMRENKQSGAMLLTNLTNDGWYPTLPRQHLEHSRLRTVECGYPLIRACNTGITAAIDSLGRDIAVLNEEGADSLHVQVPIYTYPTLYSHFGDGLIIVFSLVGLLLFMPARCLFPRPRP